MREKISGNKKIITEDISVTDLRKDYRTFVSSHARPAETKHLVSDLIELDCCIDGYSDYQIGSKQLSIKFYTVKPEFLEIPESDRKLEKHYDAQWARVFAVPDVVDSNSKKVMFSYEPYFHQFKKADWYKALYVRVTKKIIDFGESGND